MGRPQLAIGTHGKFRFYPEGDHWRVRCKVRDFDGTIREVQRVGRSKALAERSLSEALRDRARVDADAEVTPDTRLTVIAELWFSQFQEQDRSLPPCRRTGTSSIARYSPDLGTCGFGR